MILFGLDLETTGLQHKHDRAVEIGGALYDTTSKSIIESYSSLVWDFSFPIPSEEAMKVNGIQLSTLQGFGQKPDDVYNNIASMMKDCDAVIGHNILSFDLPFIKYEFEQVGIPMPDKVIIDSRYDVPYPDSMTSKRLSHLAVDHGIVVTKLHRALADVELIFDIIKHYDIDEIYDKAKSPMIRIEAETKYEDRDEAKRLRYNWDATLKKWWKNIREVDFDKETNLAKFLIKKVTT